MAKLNVKIKKLVPSAIIPKYAHDTDAGLDLTVTSVKYLSDFGAVQYGFGIALEIPKGYVGMLFPRSSVYKSNLSLSNCVGVIDSGYRGEVKAVFYDRPEYSGLVRFWDRIKYIFGANLGNDVYTETFVDDSTHYKVGERACQLIIMPYPKVTLTEVDELEESDRSTGGYGSTGK